jgi:hypothetical protein
LRVFHQTWGGEGWMVTRRPVNSTVRHIFSLMRLLLLLPFLLGACTTTPVPRVTQNNATPTLERTPDERLVRGIDRLGKLAGLAPLRSSNLAQGDVEAGVWYGFGLILLEGFAIKRTNNQWTAFQLKANGADPAYITRVARIQLAAPKSGWEQCWQRFADAGILTLPSGTEGPDPDVEAFYVETMTGGSYRNYQYISSEYEQSPNASRILAIGDTIYEEFGLTRFHVAKRSH